MPTGLPGSAPVGPAMPVVAMAMLVLSVCRAPCAIWSATSWLTSVSWCMVCGETLRSLILSSLQ